MSRDRLLDNLNEATRETLSMVGWSAPVAIAIGPPLGIGLATTHRRGVFTLLGFNAALGIAVNIGRSLPFIRWAARHPARDSAPHAVGVPDPFHLLHESA